MSRVKEIRSRPAFNCSWQRETWFSSHISSDAASVRNIFIPSFRSWLAALLSCVFPTRNYSKLHSLWLHSSERGGRNEVIRQSNRSERRFNQANGKLGSGMLPVFFSIRTHTGWLCAPYALGYLLLTFPRRCFSAPNIGRERQGKRDDPWTRKTNQDFLSMECNKNTEWTKIFFQYSFTIIRIEYI